MIHRFFLIAFLSLICFRLVSQQLTSSNLPIIIIDTDGLEILDEPKVTARMRVIDNADGTRNQVDSESPQYDGFIGIELRGQSSLYLFPKKGYGIETRDANGMDLNVALLGMPEENDWVIHSPYSDKSLIRNTLAYMIAGELMDYAPRVRMVELIINNNYQGVVLWTEKIKRDQNRVNINRLDPDENTGDDLTGGYILKFDKGETYEVGWESPYLPIVGSQQRTRFLYHYPKPEDITLQQKAYIRSWITEFENNLMSGNYSHPVNGYAGYIDVESFVHTILINELTRNVDAYRLSTYMYKQKDSDGGKLFMGPVWDFNLAWGNADYCSGSDIFGWGFNFNAVCPGDYWANHVWWNRLIGEEQFRQNVKDTWSTLRQGVLSSENILSKIDSLVNLLGEAQIRNFIRWPVHGLYVWPNEYVGINYEDDISYLKNWIVSRAEWLDNAFKGLTTSVVDVNDADDVRIYPNPTSGTIFLESDKYVQKAEFYTFSGQLIRSVNIENSSVSIQIDLNSLNGLIWYKIFRKDGEVVTGKITNL